MQPFHFERAVSLRQAAEAAREEGTMILAGGTTLVDLMRAGLAAPSRVLDISGLDELRQWSMAGPMLRLGALVSMAEVADDDAVRRDYPALAQSLQQAASQQLRNMATLGGNLLQRTRCGYFRDGTSPCNRRAPGSGCAALAGYNREHAVLGASEYCVAVYPGDWAIALVAFDAEVELFSPDGLRSLPVETFFREPGDTPHRETALRPGEIVTAIRVPVTPAGRRSTFLKVRDRQSYAFALVSVAAALHLEGDVVVEARVALGGVATRPWRSREAEAELLGQPLSLATAGRAGEAAFAGGRALADNGVKLRLGPRVVAEALRIAGGRDWT